MEANLSNALFNIFLCVLLIVCLIWGLYYFCIGVELKKENVKKQKTKYWTPEKKIKAAKRAKKTPELVRGKSSGGGRRGSVKP
jgi:hypothetical protein